MKNFNKKGFSLLEVMLAVAIMAIASSMIMYGFVSSMSYANNSSIYARSAAYNARGNYYFITKTAHKERGSGATSRYAVLATDTATYGGSTKHTISIQGGSLNVDINARTFRMASNGPLTTDASPDPSGATVNTATFNVGSSVVADSREGTGSYADATVADNRTGFFYTVPDVNFPAEYTCPDGKCPICGTDYTLQMHRRGGQSLTTGNFHYVCPNYAASDHAEYYARVLAQW